MLQSERLRWRPSRLGAAAALARSGRHTNGARLDYMLQQLQLAGPC